MRLICPNCGAQYEVDASVIPEQGRDVQCSNCGHTWFQQPAGGGQDDIEDAFEEGDDLVSGDVETEEHSDEPAKAGPDGQSRPELDPDIAQLLREEAERETAARQAESDAGLETQPDLGIAEAEDAASARTAAARARMARMRGADDADADASLISGAARKELLPDVEEINSSLRPADEREAQDANGAFDPIDEGAIASEQRSRGIGRFLFRSIVVLALVAMAIYVFAPQIVEQLPQSEPYLAQYVGAVNGLRAQLDPVIGSLSDQVQSWLGGGSENPEAAPSDAAPGAEANSE